MADLNEKIANDEAKDLIQLSEALHEKKIAQIANHEEAEELVAELIDRYGDLPDVTVDLIRISEIKCFAAELGVRSISERGGRYVIEFNEENNADAFTLIVAKQKYGDQLVISSGNNPFLSSSER